MLSMPACFTGIESTPKITADDVKKQQATETPEERFLKDIVPVPLSRWEKGKLFYVTDDKINLALEPGSDSYPKAGEYMEFRAVREIPSMTGKPDTELAFATQNGNEVRYRLSFTPEELAGRARLEIPFTIEISLVDEARNALLGQTYYIKTSTWFDDEGMAQRGLKFIPVKITDVTPGNTVYPVKLQFITGSGASQPAYLYMSAGDTSRVARSFASLFYFDDPHKRYPQITDEIWDNIIHGRVARDMTREECRLSLGAPKTIDRSPGISTMRELWNYENGIYLIFDDGLLQSYRN